MKDQDQIVLQFKDKNPNGSMEAITGICDESGLVCAMMPHPERACEEILGSNDGLNFLEGFISDLNGSLSYWCRSRRCRINYS